MHTLLLMAATSIPGAILFLVLVLILKQMPEEAAESEASLDLAEAPSTSVSGRAAPTLG